MKFFALPHNFSFIIATGFYSGLTPKLPGTAGSLASIPVWFLLYYAGLWDSIFIRCSLVLAFMASGIWASSQVIKRNPSNKDPQHIVIDEWCGMLIAFLAVSRPSVLAIALVFFWFRLFDILKPGPVRWCESFPGAWGVMADDCVAGCMACLMVFLCYEGLGNL